MNVEVRITGLVQRVDLESGDVANMLELELVDGSKITAPVSEREAEHILHLSVGVPHTQQEESPRMRQQIPTDDVRVFGGDAPATTVREDVIDTPEALAASLLNGMSPEARRSTRSSAYTNKEGVTTPLRTVTTVDDMGNPMLPGLRNLEPTEAVADGRDEDGVRTA